MAESFLARGANATGMERLCVLKRILLEHASDAQFVQMFLDEARLAAQLQHPNIASVYDIGMLGDSYFFTMEYVHGETVRSLLHRASVERRPLPLACVLTIIAGAAAGLHHAHERVSNDGRPLGIVHRDVSPPNLMVSFEGNVKIVDFSVAKAADRTVEARSGTVKGKISYFSPEQCRGARVDRRSDLFSLGIVMWEMLTGVRLYRRVNDFENMTAIVNEPPLRPSARRAEVPRTIDDIVLRLLAKSVTDRFQTAGEVVEAIENASMRARTILSTLAVGRLIRDLFGTRAEPWLELDTDTLPSRRPMLASMPLPQEIGRAPRDPVEAELAAVPDLSISSIFEEELGEDLTSSELPAIEPGSAQPSAPASPTSQPAQPEAATAGPSALLRARASLPRVPAAPASASTLLGGSAPSPTQATTVGPTGSTLTAAPSSAVQDLSPVGSITATSPEPVTTGPPAVTSSDSASSPILVDSSISTIHTPTQVSPWPPAGEALASQTTDPAVPLRASATDASFELDFSEQAPASVSLRPVIRSATWAGIKLAGWFCAVAIIFGAFVVSLGHIEELSIIVSWGILPIILGIAILVLLRRLRTWSAHAAQDLRLSFIRGIALAMDLGSTCRHNSLRAIKTSDSDAIQSDWDAIAVDFVSSIHESSSIPNALSQNRNGERV